MQELIQQIVAGLAAGGIYASLALALVIIYSAMGLINFAQGEFAMFATFIAWVLIVGLGLPFAVGIVTLALFTIVNGAAGFIWGYVPRNFPSPFPAHAMDLAGVYVSIQDVAV